MEGKTPHPSTPHSDPSRSQLIGRAHDPEEDRQLNEQLGHRDLDPAGERTAEPRRDARDDER
jgi:hypothetical protein